MNFEIKLSQRVCNIEQSASIVANEAIASLHKQGKNVINLSIGEPDFYPADKVKEEAMLAIAKNVNAYTNAQGILELRQAISKKLREENGIVADPGKNILVTPGVKQALFYLNSCLINPGDEIIVLEPYWFTYLESVKLCDGIPVPVVGKEEKGFKPTTRQIEEKITSKTKYIVLSNPCNPTGAVWDIQELKEIVSLAKAYNLLIIADEIYEKIIFDNHKFVSIASLPEAEEITITLNGFSKCSAIQGWRVGFVVANEVIIKAMLKIQQQVATCVNSIAQRAAVVAFEQTEEIKKMVQVYQQRRDLMVNGLNSIMHFQCKKPLGGLFIFVNISSLNLGSVAAASILLEKLGIGVVPGVAYGKNFDHYLRFSFTTSEENIREAVKRLTLFFGTKK